MRETGNQRSFWDKIGENMVTDEEMVDGSNMAGLSDKEPGKHF